MAVKRSSTSNSRPRLGPPWGLAGAIVLLLLLEMLLRWLNPHGGVPSDADEGQFAYLSVPFELQRGAPDVIIVGSSRARRGVLAPVIQRAILENGLGRSVKNFSLGGAEAEEVELVIRRIAEAPSRPKLIVWAIAAREFKKRRSKPSAKVRYLWRPRDWLRARGDLGARADKYLPDAIRNDAARWSLVARYRAPMRELLVRPSGDEPWQQFKQILRPVRGSPTPLQGGIASIYRRSDRNASHRVSIKRVKRYLGNSYKGRRWPRGYQAARFEAALRLTRELGVPLLLVELPTHELLERLMPKNTQAKFRRYVSGVATDQHIPFVRVTDLDARFTRRDFREQSHLNYRGASRYSKAVASFVVESLRAAKRR